MTVKNTQFKSTIAEIVDVATSDINNPFLTKISFIFADNRGNGNNQGVKEDEFDRIAESAVNMPIKMNFEESDLKGHEFSVPIGHITGMTREAEGDVIQLVGEALLYKGEFPQQVDFLKKKHAEGEAPGISWEIAYHDSVLENGIEWLKQAITMAATFVKSPAYGKRTKLLAIAQQTTEEEFITKVKEIMDSQASNNEPKGGNKVEEELAKAQASLAEALAKVTDLEGKLAEATTKATELEETNQTLSTENETFKTQATLNERTSLLAEAGIEFKLDGEALTAKQAYWLSMSEENFNLYVADLKSVKTVTTVATAGQKGNGLPKFTAVAGQESLTLDDLKAQARKASRGELADL